MEYSKFWKIYKMIKLKQDIYEFIKCQLFVGHPVYVHFGELNDLRYFAACYFAAHILHNRALWELFTVVGSIELVGTQTHFLSCDLKAAYIKVHRCLIRELMLYKSELRHNAAEAIKYISFAKDVGAVDYSTINEMYQEISLKFQEPQLSGKVR